MAIYRRPQPNTRTTISTGGQSAATGEHEDATIGREGSEVMDEVPSRFERLWTIEEVADYLAMSPQTLYGWRCRRYGPPSYRIGNKVRYRPDEVRAWVDAQSSLAS